MVAGVRGVLPPMRCVPGVRRMAGMRTVATMTTMAGVPAEGPCVRIMAAVARVTRIPGVRQANDRHRSEAGRAGREGDDVEVHG
jgi:hypothetical protein